GELPNGAGSTEGFVLADFAEAGARGLMEARVELLVALAAIVNALAAQARRRRPRAADQTAGERSGRREPRALRHGVVFAVLEPEELSELRDLRFVREHGGTERARRRNRWSLSTRMLATGSSSSFVVTIGLRRRRVRCAPRSKNPRM